MHVPLFFTWSRTIMQKIVEVLMLDRSNGHVGPDQQLIGRAAPGWKYHLSVAPKVAPVVGWI